MMIMMGGGLRGAHHQPAMLDTLGADQPVCQPLYISRLPPQNDHFETAIVVQMGVKRGNNHLMMLMLEIGKLFRQKAGLMVIDERYRPDYQGIGSDHR
jgi:hypothetical protein